MAVSPDQIDAQLLSGVRRVNIDNFKMSLKTIQFVIAEYEIAGWKVEFQQWGDGYYLMFWRK